MYNLETSMVRCDNFNCQSSKGIYFNEKELIRCHGKNELGDYCYSRCKKCICQNCVDNFKLTYKRIRNTILCNNCIEQCKESLDKFKKLSKTISDSQSEQSLIRVKLQNRYNADIIIVGESGKIDMYQYKPLKQEEVIQQIDINTPPPEYIS
jgi:hypothetical protein